MLSSHFATLSEEKLVHFRIPSQLLWQRIKLFKTVKSLVPAQWI